MSLIWLSIACIEPSVKAIIVPSSPSTEDTLRIQLSGDPAEILSVRWIKNDVVFGQGKFLGPNFTSRDESWSAEVSVMSDKPFNINAASVRVANTPPSVDSIAIVPTAPVSGEEMSCLATASDVDFDFLNIAYRWDGPDGFVRSDTIGADRLTPGLWICTAIATDGDLESTAMTESVFVDENPDAATEDDTPDESDDEDTGDTDNE